MLSVFAELPRKGVRLGVAGKIVSAGVAEKPLMAELRHHGGLRERFTNRLRGWATIVYPKAP